MEKAYKFRAYPSKDTQEVLNRQMYLSKELYNLLLNKSKDYYKETKKTLTEYKMNVWITSLKKERPEFAELHAQVLQNVSKRISDAYKSYFRRCKEKKAGKKVKVGFPRFKKFVVSLTYPQAAGFKIEKKRIFLSKIGKINFVNHREIEGKIKVCTIKKTKSGDWYITFIVEQDDKPFASNGKQKVGIDLGVTQFVASSDNKIRQNAGITKSQRLRLRLRQKSISRKVKGSKNREKAVKRFAKYYEHLVSIRQDALHKLSHDLVNSYSFIAYEELQVQNMLKNHYLARSIQESSWGNFIRLLQYKAGSAGCVVVAVKPQYTSMTCNKCGNVQEILLSQRTFVCERCGWKEDRDINAAKNILERALNSMNSNFDGKTVKATAGLAESQAFGDDVRPSVREAVANELGTILGGAHLDR